uniref:Uncharacterized protein n=1 Tax=Timema bartmani TaxID=61472 RepID=A0A7R9F916_9NEOP|nr:unnamed protein product [Timema bartmani]
MRTGFDKRNLFMCYVCPKCNVRCLAETSSCIMPALRAVYGALPKPLPVICLPCSQCVYRPVQEELTETVFNTESPVQELEYASTPTSTMTHVIFRDEGAGTIRVSQPFCRPAIDPPVG